MDKLLELTKKYINPLFNTRAAGIYILLFAISIGVATFIENDYGTSAAQKVVFKAWWFELLLLLFGICILFNVSRFRMIQQRRWALLTFHISMIIILIGAGVTRYFGYEGIMHIRENNSSNTFLSAETYLQYEVIKDKQKYEFSEPVLFASLGNNRFNESYQIGNDLLEVRVRDFIPNPVQQLESTAEGSPIIKIVVAGSSGREEYFVGQGESRTIKNVLYNFNENYIPDAINILFEENNLLIKSDRILTQMVMATQQLDTLFPSSDYYPLRLRSMYSDGMNSFVFGDFNHQGIVKIVSEDPKVKNESITALLLDLTVNGITKQTYVFGKKGVLGRPTIVNWDNFDLGISYGAKTKALPFDIKLYDFIMERYPGTNSAASYASEVQLIDNRKQIKKDYRIYMNHILDHSGYRFFQSSFDKDEQGTYLSVNHDFWGTWISYLGYFLLTVGLILSLFSKKSRFQKVAQNIKRMRANQITALLFLVAIFMPSTSSGQKVVNPVQSQHIVAEHHAKKFSSLVVQDFKGRMKPMHTLSREIMRKLTKSESFKDLTADQVILGMFADSRDWNSIPMIKLGKHQDIQKLLGVSSEYASFVDFFTAKGDYVLREEVRRAYSLQPIDRGVFEKELMKIDEKVNITSLVYSGRLFKIIPIENDPNNIWISNKVDDPLQAKENSTQAQRFFDAYLPALRDAMHSDDYGLVDKMIDELSVFQKEKGAAVIPSELKVRAEILLNNLHVFSRLAFFYMMLGLVFLFLLFFSIFKPSFQWNGIYKILFSLVVLGFLFHTTGLGLRWYVSGRAPWSNGYESMIYIAWTTTLAGIIFTRKSLGGLAATMVLAATVLLVASLSYLDPEITPLVPVLKSYWLTIHVSLEAGSYGFLMLGAITGLINLILMIFLTQSNRDRIVRMVREMSYISEMTLIGGLIMVSVGTYLGGVWANESWGRYWGWDAKETWALVTILVYAFILHMRIIPKLNSLYAYNLATLFGWGTVIMTYYGVNYYLSGLHSYAAGDPVPIPQWVYIAVGALAIISILAYWRKTKYGIRA